MTHLHIESSGNAAHSSMHSEGQEQLAVLIQYLLENKPGTQG
jgi:hypothetical protein